jgi:hypothetical protein
MCQELIATGREDLVAAVEQGKMSIAAALKIAKPKKYDRKTIGLQTLILAWERASEDDRAEFRKLIEQKTRSK